MKQKPLVSVNIRTYNSAVTLPETLGSFSKQTYPNMELIISDGYSKDGSVEISKSFGAVITYAKELGDARYKNFIYSKGKYVLSLDSDQVMDRNLIAECVTKCEKQDCDALIISEKSFITHNTFLEKLIAYDKYLIGKDRHGSKIFDNACPRFFKKDVLFSIPWPKKLSIFDDTILYAMLVKSGAKVGYVKKASIWHNEVVSWKIFIKKFYRYGKGYFRALDVSPKVVVVHSLPRRSYFRKEALSNPKYFFGLFLLYFVKTGSALAGAVGSLPNLLFHSRY